MSDADLTILEHQLAKSQALNGNELSEVITVDTELPADIDGLINTIKVYFNQNKSPYLGP